MSSRFGIGREKMQILWEELLEPVEKFPAICYDIKNT
jgi:hypothetical protein